jgi:hypothetical protein
MICDGELCCSCQPTSQQPKAPPENNSLARRPILRLQPGKPALTGASQLKFGIPKKWQRKISLSFLCLCRLLAVWLVEQSYWMTRVVSHSNPAASMVHPELREKEQKAELSALVLMKMGSLVK